MIRHTDEHETKRYLVAFMPKPITFCREVTCELFDKPVGKDEK